MIRESQSTEKKDRGIRFWRHCAAEPHCIRLLPENQPRTRTEAILRRAVTPGDPRAYFDHRGRFIYPSCPVAMEMDAIRERRRQGLEMVRRQTELLKSLVLKEPPKPQMEDMNIDAMRKRLEQARRENVPHTRQQQQQTSPALPVVEGSGSASHLSNRSMGQ